jgi:uncharacterized protein
MNCDQDQCGDVASVHFLRVRWPSHVEERCVCKEHARVVVTQYRAQQMVADGVADEYPNALRYGIDFVFYDEATPPQDGGGGWVYLRDFTGPGRLAFQTGYCELAALRLALTRCTSQRPLTYPLIATIIAALGGKVVSVVFDKVEERGHVFHAKIRILTHEGEAVIDARPSDAVILAVVCEAPIYVGINVIEEAGRTGKREQRDGSL